MSDTDTRHADLERRLRAAAATVPTRPVRSDAWVEHQRRLAADARQRSRRILTVAAGVALVLAFVGLVALITTTEGRSGLPASGGRGSSEDVWAPENVLGEPQLVEQLTFDGVRTDHEVVLSDTDGSGPMLCDRFTAADASSESGGCTNRQPDADDPSVAVDWVSGTTGGGSIHGIVVGVDDRVAKVRIYLSNGDMTLADLRPTGWEGTTMFGLTLKDSPETPVPQRLVAYADAKGTVLQAVDLADLFGSEWLGEGGSCSTEDPAPVDDTSGSMRLTFTPSRLGVFTGGAGNGSPSQCLTLGPAVQGAVQDSKELVLVVSPEVSEVRLQQGSSTAIAGGPAAVRSSLWRVAVVHADRPLSPDDRVTAFDAMGNQIYAVDAGSFR